MIKLGQLDNTQVQNLLQIHLSEMHNNSPAENSFALDLSDLRHPKISFYSLWDQNELLACGAIQELSATHGELKSMRTHPKHLRKGAASKVLTHLLHVARLRKYRTLSLETGTSLSFEPAVALYIKFGFVQGSAFGEYTESEHNQFFHLSI